MEKKELRLYIREQKRHFSQQELTEMSFPIISKLLSHPKVTDADVILMYHSLPDEVFTHEALDALVRMGKRVLLPKVVGESDMTVHEYRTKEDLQFGSFGILEPSGEEADINNIVGKWKVVGVIPGVAFDVHGNRLGRGKGYYDRFLECCPSVYRIGLCFGFQMVENVPVSSNDLPMNEILTE